MPQLVSYAFDGKVATITMDDGKVNVLSPAMQAELNAALDRAEADQAVVLLSGRPGVFSAGFDLAVLQSQGDEASAMVSGGFELSLRLLGFPRPVVVACTGHAIAMGSFLLLSGDYRLGADGPYKIRANEVAIGLEIPQAAIEICRQRMTPAFLTRALLLAEVFSPADCVAGGYLDQVVPAGELAGAAHSLATALAGLDPSAHAASKRRLRAELLPALRDAIESRRGSFGDLTPPAAQAAPAVP
jgi:enoyl-CoA hydratase/carnithine racemase